jgi:acetyl-CoA carboxylase biotin carboxyl carrier protein
MELTHGDVKNIIQIINEAEHLDEIELVFAGFRLHVRRGGGSEPSPAPYVATPAAAPAAQIAARPAAAPAAAPLLHDAHDAHDAHGASVASAARALAPGQVAVRSPMLGTFYHAPSPGEKPFVEVGQRVTAHDNVGVVEVMKLFNTIRAGVDGTVVGIEAGNASLVEFNQILIVIDTTRV